MSQLLPYKTKQFFFVLIKISLVITAFYFIYTKLNDASLNLSLISNKMDASGFKFILSGTTLLILSSLNWFFEILKWLHLTQPIKHITFIESSKQCLASLTASIFTPNRIAEYGAKALFFRVKDRKQIMISNLISNLAQMSTTLIFGSIGLLFFCSQHHIKLGYLNFYYLLTGAIIIGLFIFITTKRTKYVLIHPINTFIKLIKNYNNKLLLKVFLFSVLRYLIFSYQFYYLLHFFNIELGYFSAITTITTMYLLSSVIPSIAVFDVAIKGSIAVFLFSFFNISTITILSITTIMWTFNFVLPSIIGSYFVLNFKYSNSLY